MTEIDWNKAIAHEDELLKYGTLKLSEFENLKIIGTAPNKGPLISFIFDDISPGLLAIPFWIPRISMSIGVTIFLIALIDDFFTVWKKEQPSYVKNADPILKDNT